MVDSIIFTSLETESAQPAITYVYGRNFASTSGPQSSTVAVTANGAARINGGLRIGGTSTVSTYSSQPAVQITSGIAGAGVVGVSASGNARVNGEILERGTSVVSVFAGPLKVAEAFGDASFEPLTSLGANYQYGEGEVSFEPFTGDGDELDFNIEYAISDNDLVAMVGDGFGLTGVLGDGEVTFEPLVSIGTNFDYGVGEVSFEPLRGAGFENITVRQTVDLRSPGSRIAGDGRVTTVGGTLTQPESEASGLSAWGPIQLRQPASQLEIEATNPPVGRALLTQSESTIDATGLTGAVGGATLEQPKSKLSASDSWKVQLEQPNTAIDATGLAGRVGGTTLDQPKSAIEGEGTILNLGRADLTQPESELVQAVEVLLDQPESVLSAIGLRAPSEETGRAFAVNYENAAVTEYDTFPFAAIAEFNGGYYAVGPEGVYRLDPHSGDNGAAIRSEVRFAEQEQGGQRRRGHLTKITYLYFFVDGKESFDAILTTGEGHERKYRVQQRDGDNVHTRRVTAGKGVKARSWGLGFIHEGTDHFRLYDVEMVGEVLQRKV